MTRATGSAVLLCAAVIAASCGRSAAGGLLVVAGGHCPVGSPVPAGEASEMATAGCLLLAPAVRARLSIAGSATIPARVCGMRAAEIADLGAVVCRQPPVGGPGPRAPILDGSRPVAPSPDGATVRDRRVRPFPLPLLFVPVLSLSAYLIVRKARRTGQIRRHRTVSSRGTLPFSIALHLAFFGTLVFGAIGALAWLDVLGIVDP